MASITRDASKAPLDSQPVTLLSVPSLVAAPTGTAQEGATDGL